MSNFFRSILIVAAVTGFSGCMVHSFVPQTHNVPLFTDKHQLKISPSLSFRSVDVNLAYSPIKHLGIITNLQYGGNYIVPEIGVGAYHSINEKFVLEIYAGYGYSFINFADTVYRFTFSQKPVKAFKYYNTNIAANKYFIQPNIGLRLNDNFELAVSMKITYWQYLHYYYNYERWEVDRDPYNPPYYTLYLAQQNKTGFNPGPEITVEPAITLKFGWRSIKFIVQAGTYSVGNVSGIRLDPYGGEFPNFIKTGICIGFDYKKNKKSHQ
jgi:hypothetical protein